MRARSTLAVLFLLLPRPAVAASQELDIDAREWRVVQRQSGPDDYYSVEHDVSYPSPFIHSRYRPPEATSVLGFEVPAALRTKVRTVRWEWRAVVLPKGGDECADRREDSAAVVYVTYRRGLRFYTLKYVWSAVGARGATCDRKRNLLFAQDTIIVESGGPVGTWKSEQIDVNAEFHAHFENGQANADVAPLVGIGLMSDGDQTRSESSADFGKFVLGW